MASNLPNGTVTFLFTDIEGSASIAQQHPDIWEALRERHDVILRHAIEIHNGYVFEVIGDASCSAFHTVGDSIDAASQAQRDLQAEAWGEVSIQVRMGIHTGEAQVDAGHYRGYLTLTRAQRVMSAAYGGQILLSNSSAELVREALPANVTLISLGEHHLKSLANPQRIWQVVAPGLRRDFPPLEKSTTLLNNLPAQLTSFVGRETEIAEVSRLLQSHRLVTLTGAGGTGKTRLSLQVAEGILDKFTDGVWFVELASLADPALVPNTVASVLGVREEHNRLLLPTLLDWLRNRQMLLVLDNCEHLIQACANFADVLLRASRDVRLLSTSREALGVAGEIAYHVPSLESPQPAEASRIPLERLAQFAAVRLFIERARESWPAFRMTNQNAPTVAQICYRLDGIPLAIELAAARVKVLSVDEIAQRLSERFRLLTGGGRLALPRHQTLRSLIDWSYNLLTEPEQTLLRRLSIFAGGWTLQAAEEVCAGSGLEPHDVLDLLTHLVDKSLVAREEAPIESRYGMLETIREYARERLSDSGEALQIRGRHLAFMLALAETAYTHGHRLDEGIWHDRLEQEVDNLRAALEWALSLEDTELALKLAGSVYWFWWTRGYWHEANAWLRQALDKHGAEKPTAARAQALHAMGWFLYMGGDLAEARLASAESVKIDRALGDKWRLAESLTVLGLVASLEDYKKATRMLDEGLGLSRELGYTQGIASALLGLGNCRVSEGNDEEAREHYRESAGLFKQTGDKSQLAFAARQLGLIALRRLDYPKALTLCAESLTLNLETRDHRGVAASFAAIASIAAQQGQGGPAARLYGATAALLEATGVQLIPMDHSENEPYMLSVRAQMGKDAYDRTFSEGHAMKLDQAVAYALQQTASLHDAPSTD